MRLLGSNTSCAVGCAAVTFNVALALLFCAVGSMIPLPTLATAVIVRLPHWLLLSVRFNVATAPLASESKCQFCVVTLKVPDDEVTPAIVKSAGIVNATADAAADGPVMCSVI